MNSLHYASRGKVRSCFFRRANLGQIEFRECLSMTISVDHDVIDGAPATRFALRLKELVESGYGLIDQVSSARRSNSMLQS